MLATLEQPRDFSASRAERILRERTDLHPARVVLQVWPCSTHAERLQRGLVAMQRNSKPCDAMFERGQVTFQSDGQADQVRSLPDNRFLHLLFRFCLLHRKPRKVPQTRPPLSRLTMAH